MEDFIHMLTEEGERIGLDLPPSIVSMSESYYRLLTEWNQRVNLTSITKIEEVIRYHFLEGFFLARFLPPWGKMIDVGSGAGFPVIPAKLLSPQLELILIEPTVRKALFLREVVRELSLSPVDVFRGRMEEFDLFYPGLKVDVVTARALGRFQPFFSFCRRVISPSGKVILFLSERGKRELTSSVSGFSVITELPLPTRKKSFLLFFAPV
jgi:16S rRNA (guanine527-N7)-methyltransferase